MDAEGPESEFNYFDDPGYFMEPFKDRDFAVNHAMHMRITAEDEELAQGLAAYLVEERAGRQVIEKVPPKVIGKNPMTEIKRRALNSLEKSVRGLDISGEHTVLKHRIYLDESWGDDLFVDLNEAYLKAQKDAGINDPDRLRFNHLLTAIVALRSTLPSRPGAKKLSGLDSAARTFLTHCYANGREVKAYRNVLKNSDGPRDEVKHRHEGATVAHPGYIYSDDTLEFREFCVDAGWPRVTLYDAYAALDRVQNKPDKPKSETTE